MYIRTKDGIFEVTNEQERYFNIKIKGFGGAPMYKEMVIKQADTIEELCDVFIKKSKELGNDYFNISTDAFTVFDKKYENYKKWFEHYDYYGAIWTDKGLIYVAKMNAEGVLELL